jgi:ubiquinone/menaquinone biosynthesis C-methylase UbiE
MSQLKKDEISFFNQSAQVSGREECVNNLDNFINAVYTALRLNHSTKDQFVLDAGCGSGDWGLKLAKNGYAVIGADISKVQVKQAHDKAKTAKLPFLPIVCDLEKLPLRQQSFQICICGYVLHHFRNLDDILPEISRVLNIHGMMVTVDPNGTNLVHTVIRNLESFLPRSWFMKNHVATSNECAHSIKFYLKALKKTNLRINYALRSTSVPRFSQFNLFVLLITIRSISFEICKILLPDLNGKSEIIIIAQKTNKIV